MAEEHAHPEMLAEINGPEVTHSDSLVKSSIANYSRNFKHQDG